MGIISTIEDSIIQSVNDVLMQPGNEKLKVVESLPGAWSYDLLKRVLQKAPAVYVAFLGGKRSIDASDIILDGRFDVYVITKQADEVTRRRGNARVIGAYDIIETIIPAINGRTIQDVGSLNLTGINNLFGEAMLDLGGTVYAATFSLPNMVFPYELDLLTLDNFITFHADHDLDTSQADEPVASDDVTLPQ